MINVFIVRRSKKHNQKILRDHRPKIFSFIRNILISPEDYTDTEVASLWEEQFGALTRKSYISLIPTLEDVAKQEKQLIGSPNYNAIILGLKVDSYLEKRLDFSNTRIRLRAFQSLSRLELTISDSKILPHTYAKNTSLRKESRASYVGVSNNDPFKFFELDNELNEWDHISLMQQFELHHSDKLPNFSKWIKYSKDKAQILFFVKMVAHFRQETSVSTITELLTHEDHTIRMESILTVGRMQVKDIENQLIKMYFTQPLMCQNAIIEAISYINSGKSLGFLKMAYDLTNNYDSKKLIAEVIYLYGKAGQQLFKELVLKAEGFDQLILKHVENPLIPSALKTYHANSKNFRVRASGSIVHTPGETPSI